MKMMLIVHDAVFAAEVAEALEAAGCRVWTRLEKVLGRGEATGPRLDSPVWPGFNQALLLALEPEVAEALLAALRDLRDSARVKGLRVFTWEAAQEI